MSLNQKLKPDMVCWCIRPFVVQGVAELQRGRQYIILEVRPGSKSIDGIDRVRVDPGPSYDKVALLGTREQTMKMWFSSANFEPITEE